MNRFLQQEKPGLSAIHPDMIERARQSLAQLQKEQAAGHHVPVVFEVLPDGGLSFLNQAIFQLTGFEAQDLDGDGCFSNLFPQEDARRAARSSSAGTTCSRMHPSLGWI